MPKKEIGLNRIIRYFEDAAAVRSVLDIVKYHQPPQRIAINTGPYGRMNLLGEGAVMFPRI
jgi:hypothetical protein